MTAAAALAAQPILTALVACETCGEWTDRCVCPETATPAPGRDPQARIWGGDRGGRTGCARALLATSHGGCHRCPASPVAPAAPSPKTTSPPARAAHTRAGGDRSERHHPMPEPDHASGVPTESDVCNAILALDDDQKLAVADVLTMILQRTEVEIRDGSDARVACLPLRFAVAYTLGHAEAIRRDRAEEAEGVDQ